MTPDPAACPACGDELFTSAHGCPGCGHARPRLAVDPVLGALAALGVSFGLGAGALFAVGAVLPEGPVMNLAAVFVGAVFHAVAVGTALRPSAVRSGFRSGELSGIGARRGAGRDATPDEARGLSIGMGIAGCVFWTIGVWAGALE